GPHDRAGHRAIRRHDRHCRSACSARISFLEARKIAPANAAASLLIALARRAPCSGGFSQMSNTIEPRAARVLVVSADEDFRAEISRWLRAENNTVSIVADQLAMQAALRVSRPDVLIADVPDSAGAAIAVLEAARDLQPTVPVVIVSGQASVGEAVRAMQLGARSDVTKN